MNKISSVCCSLLFFGFFSSLAMTEISVVVHPSNTESSIDEKTLSQIFLGKAKQFSGGNKVVTYEQEDGKAIKEKFHSMTTKKNASSLKAYWSRMMFTGKIQPPKKVADDASIINEVANNENAIAYVDSSAVNDSVKVVHTFP